MFFLFYSCCKGMMSQRKVTNQQMKLQNRPCGKSRLEETLTVNPEALNLLVVISISL